MREWQSQLNPFNSMKVLMYAKHLEGCAQDEYLNPVTVAIDPCNRCNLDCVWCNASEVMTGGMMTKDHLLELADFLSEWKVQSTCIAGGGEPLMNPHFADFLNKCTENGLKNSVITNGILLNEKSINAIARGCRWVGISVDAGRQETYAKLKNCPAWVFGMVKRNIKLLSDKIREIGSKCEVGFKYLIHPDNQGEIYEAAALAKSLGVHDFQARPVGWVNLKKTAGKELLEFDIEKVNMELTLAMSLQTDDFRVYGIRHKFDEKFQKKTNFSRCWATSLHPTFSADGNVYLCFDRRGDKDLILCRHDPDPWEIIREWGSKRHVDMIKKIKISECPRCTFSGYNEIIEKVFVKDEMCREFV